MINEIFSDSFRSSELVDRFKTNPEHAVDVIIPVIHSNKMWEANLKSIYREIPVNRLLISDGGCIDDSLVIAKQFPRVEIFDHKNYTSLGYCLRSLIENVVTEHFIYLHSDVFLTPGWFDNMFKHRGQYDWYESSQITSFLVDIPHDYSNYPRPLSGGQLGRRAAFQQVLPQIDDDYLYRNEDMIFAELIRRAGGKYGRVDDAVLYHQVMNKESRWKRSVARFSISIAKSPEEEIRESNMQARGLVKYLPPDDKVNKYSVIESLKTLISIKQTTYEEFMSWVATTPYGPQWEKVLKRVFSYRIKVLREVAELARLSFLSVKVLGKQTFTVAKAIIGK